MVVLGGGALSYERGTPVHNVRGRSPGKGPPRVWEGPASGLRPHTTSPTHQREDAPPSSSTGVPRP
ncbi:hypothetical protein T484DRAFT_1964276 [Baffinella frigidus]|nr:hypothetical protein T484DRAFT_1964276 [Cryptophyta sp. CCMP2293]